MVSNEEVDVMSQDFVVVPVLTADLVGKRPTEGLGCNPSHSRKPSMDSSDKSSELKIRLFPEGKSIDQDISSGSSHSSGTSGIRERRRSSVASSPRGRMRASGSPLMPSSPKTRVSVAPRSPESARRRLDTDSAHNLPALSLPQGDLWTEGADSPQNIIFENEPGTGGLRIKAATLNKLIKYMTTDMAKVDPTVFFASYHAATTTSIVVGKLIERFNVPWVRSGVEEVDHEIELKVVAPIQAHVLAAIQLFVRDYGDDLVARPVPRPVSPTPPAVLTAPFFHNSSPSLMSPHAAALASAAAMSPTSPGSPASPASPAGVSPRSEFSVSPLVLRADSSPSLLTCPSSPTSPATMAPATITTSTSFTTTANESPMTSPLTATMPMGVPGPRARNRAQSTNARIAPIVQLSPPERSLGETVAAVLSSPALPTLPLSPVAAILSDPALPSLPLSPRSVPGPVRGGSKGDGSTGVSVSGDVSPRRSGDVSPRSPSPHSGTQSPRKLFNGSGLFSVAEEEGSVSPAPAEEIPTQLFAHKRVRRLTLDSIRERTPRRSMPEEEIRAIARGVASASGAATPPRVQPTGADGGTPALLAAIAVSPKLEPTAKPTKAVLQPAGVMLRNFLTSIREHHKEADHIIADIDAKLQEPRPFEREGQRVSMPPPPPRRWHTAKQSRSNSSLLPGIGDYDVSDIAKQLCLLNYQHFAAIQASEFRDLAWSKPHKHHMAPNIVKLIAFSNNVTHWVSESIVTAGDVKLRAWSMSRFIRIAKEALNLRNFDLAMAIVFGLLASSVKRLKRTIDLLKDGDKKTLKQVWALFSPDEGYKSYHHALGVPRAGIPTVPYLGLFCKDITYLETGPSYQNGLINWHKLRSLSTVYAKFQSFQQTRYPMEWHEEIQQSIARWLSTRAFPDDSALHEISSVCEPVGDGSQSCTPSPGPSSPRGAALPSPQARKTRPRAVSLLGGVLQGMFSRTSSSPPTTGVDRANM